MLKNMNIHVIVISNKPVLSFEMKKKLKKCYTRFVAMEIRMCIRRIGSATDEIEL